jgi:hypothetical protein
MLMVLMVLMVAVAVSFIVMAVVLVVVVMVLAAVIVVAMSVVVVLFVAAVSTVMIIFDISPVPDVISLVAAAVGVAAGVKVVRGVAVALNVLMLRPTLPAVGVAAGVKVVHGSTNAERKSVAWPGTAKRGRGSSCVGIGIREAMVTCGGSDQFGRSSLVGERNLPGRADGSMRCLDGVERDADANLGEGSGEVLGTGGSLRVRERREERGGVERPEVGGESPELRRGGEGEED